MAAERVQPDGYSSARNRHPSDGGAAQHDSQQQQQSQLQQPLSSHHHHQQQHRQTDADRDRDLFLRVEQLEQQIAWNYNAIRSHEETLARFDRALGHFQQDVRRALDDLTAEVRSRAPAAPESQARFEHQDVDVLATQIATVQTKVYEIDNVKTQVELLKTKLKRLEAESASHTLQIPARPESATPLRDDALQPQPPHDHHHNHHHHHHQQQQHQPLPPIHTGVPPHDHKHQITLHAQDLGADKRPNSGDLQHQVGHRSGEQLPPPGKLTGWQPNSAQPYSARETEHSGISWTSGSTTQGPKRPFDDPSPREQSTVGSPKRPKLAPLMPRKDEHHPYPASSDVSYQRSAQDVPPPPQLLTTPASATAAPNTYRFVTAAMPADGPDSWHAHDGGLSASSTGGTGHLGHGRARPRGGHVENGQEVSPVWDQKSDRHTAPPLPQQSQQLSPNGYYNQNVSRPLIQSSEGAPEYPLTPIASAVSPQDHSLMPGDSASSSKKTRTKPVRNAEGILIRKDGRPDMRSVSSANNLRKVHAKKEAEKAETDGRTPSSARSLAPATSHSASDEEEHSEDREDGVSRSATPKTQGDSSQHLSVPPTSAPTSASTTGGEVDGKEIATKWYNIHAVPKHEEHTSVQSDKREGEDQRLALINKVEVNAAEH